MIRSALLSTLILASTTLVNLGANYEIGPVTLGLKVINSFDAQGNDITYFFASRLPGEPAEGIEDIHQHPAAPRQIRGTVSIGF